MNKIAVWVSALALMVLSFGSAMAADLKIGVINIQQVMKQSKEIHAISARLQTQFKSRQDKIIALQKTLKSDMSRLKRDEAIMAQSDKASLQEKIVRNKREFDRMQQDFQQDANMAQSKEMQKFFAKLGKKINSYAKANHYDLILRNDAVPFSSDSVDVTKDILKQIS